MFTSKFKYYLLTLIPWAVFFYVTHRIGITWGGKRWLFLIYEASLPMFYLLPFAALAWRFCKGWNYAVFFAMAIALSFLGIFNYLTARFFLLDPVVQWGIWIAASAVEALSGFQFFSFLFRAGRSFLAIRGWSSSINHLLVLLLLFLFFSTWVLPPSLGAIHPPLTFDLSLLHLTLPQTYLYNHGIVNTWWLRGSFVPQFAHLIFAGGMSWASTISDRIDLFPTFLSSLMFFICLVGFIEFLKTKPQTAIGAFILFLCFPVARWHLTTAYLEPTLMVGILATFLSATAFIETKIDRYFYLLGFFSSIAFSTKHFGALYALPIIFITVLALIIKERKFRFSLFAKATLCSAVPILVFYHYNYLLTGSPLFPFIFKEPNLFFWNRESLTGFMSAIDHFKGSMTLADWLRLPWTISTSDAHSDVHQFPAGRLWIVVWVATLLAFGYRRLKKVPIEFAEILLFLSINAQTIVWYKSSPVYRYLTCEIMLMCLLFGYLLVRLPKYLVVLLCVVLVKVSHSNVGVLASQPMPTFARTPEEVKSYLAETVPSYEALQQLKAKESSDSILIYSLLDEGNWLFYPFPHIGDWFTESGYSKVLSASPEELRTFFSTHKVTHLLYNGLRASAAAPNFPESLSLYKNCLLPVVNAKKSPEIIIYEIKKDDPFCYDKDALTKESAEIIKRYYPLFDEIPFALKPKPKN